MATRALAMAALLLLAAGAQSQSAHLRLAVNGLDLSTRPFLDHTHQWPPQLSWTIHGGSGDTNLRQTAYSVAVGGQSAGGRVAGSAMRHTLPAPAWSNHAHNVSLSITLVDGPSLRRAPWSPLRCRPFTFVSRRG